MDSSSNTLANFADPRPTLPSLRSLNLPFPKMHKEISEVDLIDHLSINYLNELTDATNNTSNWKGMGPTSNSPVPSMSSCSTDSSRTSSPSPSESSSISSSSTRGRGGFRLVPCELQKADAIVLVKECVDNSSYGKAFLLVGPAAEPYRRRGPRPMTNSPRVHPYNIVPSQSLSRRVSLLSLNSQPS